MFISIWFNEAETMEWDASERHLTAKQSINLEINQINSTDHRTVLPVAIDCHMAARRRTDRRCHRLRSCFTTNKAIRAAWGSADVSPRQADGCLGNGGVPRTLHWGGPRSRHLSGAVATKWRGTVALLSPGVRIPLRPINTRVLMDDAAVAHPAALIGWSDALLVNKVNAFVTLSCLLVNIQSILRNPQLQRSDWLISTSSEWQQ